MDDKLYYCEYWKQKRIMHEGRQYQFCISDKINGNDIGSTIQYHGVIIVGEEVPVIAELNERINQEDAKIFLNYFETELRNVMISNLKWIEMKPDSQVVKVWYYTKDEQVGIKGTSDKRKYPPLRFAVTAVNVKPIDEHLAEKIKAELDSVLKTWLLHMLTA